MKEKTGKAEADAEAGAKAESSAQLEKREALHPRSFVPSFSRWKLRFQKEKCMAIRSSLGDAGRCVVPAGRGAGRKVVP